MPARGIVAEAAGGAGWEGVAGSRRRESAERRVGQAFWALIRALGLRVLPNTPGCHTVKEAVTTAQMAREVFDTPWVKLEVIGEHDSLPPDLFGLVEAARLPVAEGFEVFPSTTEDTVAAEALVAAGCRVLMPLGAPHRAGHAG